MMPRFRRRQSLRPINRIKHVVDLFGTPTAGVTVPNIIIQATDTPTLAATIGVETGSTVNAIYLKVEVSSTESDPGAIPNVYMLVGKNPGANITLPAPTATGASDNKRFIIHQEMIMLNNLAGGNPRVLFNGVIVIPKGMRRFGPKDELTVNVRSTSVNFAYCLQCHYKEFR